MGLQTEWLRLGRSGPTIDGRIIKEEWLDDAAATYDTKNSITAKIWPDHNRYVSYGKVLAVRVEKNDVGGKDLYGTLEPNAYYLSDVRYGQRVNFSMEITPDFLKSGKAYLTGLGATDAPASLATSEAKFSQYAEKAGVFRADFVEKETKVFEDPTPSGLLNQIKELFTKNQPEGYDMATKAEIEKLSKDVADVKTLLSKLVPSDQNPNTEDQPDDKFAQLSKDIESLKALFSKKTDGNDADDKKEQTQEEKLSALTENVAALSQQFTALQDGKSTEDKSETITSDRFNKISDQVEAFGKKLADALKEQPGTDGGKHFSTGNADAEHIV